MLKRQDSDLLAVLNHVADRFDPIYENVLKWVGNDGGLDNALNKALEAGLIDVVDATTSLSTRVYITVHGNKRRNYLSRKFRQLKEPFAPDSAKPPHWGTW